MDGFICLFLGIIILGSSLSSGRLIRQVATLIANQEKAFAQQQEILEELKKLNLTSKGT